MTVYIVMLSIVTVLALAAGNRTALAGGIRGRRSFAPAAALVGLVMVAVAALRWHVGTDYWTYESLFPAYVKEAAEGLNLWDEPGVRVLAWLANKIDGDVATMFALASIITIGLSVRTIWRWSPVFALSIAIYVFSGSWQGSFNAVRQYLACAILFAGHRYVVDRKILRWIAVVFAAALFHVSALAGLLFYLVPTQRLRVRSQILLFALALVGVQGSSVLLGLLEQVNPRDTAELGAYALVQVNPLRVAFTFLPLLVYWVFPKPTIIEQRNAWFYVNMLFIYAAAMLASSSSALLARFVIYPQIFACIGIAYVTALRNGYERTVVRGIVLALFAFFWYVEVAGIPNLNNFQWIFYRY